MRIWCDGCGLNACGSEKGPVMDCFVRGDEVLNLTCLGHDSRFSLVDMFGAAIAEDCNFNSSEPSGSANCTKLNVN